MKIEIAKNLEEALLKLREDGIEVKVELTGKGDNYFVIKTKNYEVRIGASDLGVWLDYIKEIKNER